MTRRVAWLHLWLGLICALPMFAWTSSGFVGALPRSTTSGVHYQALEMPRLRVEAQEAARAAQAVSDPPLKISSMSLEQRDGRLSWLVIGGSRGGARRRRDRSGRKGRARRFSQSLFFGSSFPVETGQLAHARHGRRYRIHDGIAAHRTGAGLATPEAEKQSLTKAVMRA